MKLLLACCVVLLAVVVCLPDAANARPPRRRDDRRPEHHTRDSTQADSSDEDEGRRGRGPHRGPPRGSDEDHTGTPLQAFRRPDFARGKESDHTGKPIEDRPERGRGGRHGHADRDDRRPEDHTGNPLQGGHRRRGRHGRRDNEDEDHTKSPLANDQQPSGDILRPFFDFALGLELDHTGRPFVDGSERRRGGRRRGDRDDDHTHAYPEYHTGEPPRRGRGRRPNLEDHTGEPPERPEEGRRDRGPGRQGRNRGRGRW